MIAPDTKDWTWVLDRPCPECAFDASGCTPDAVAGLIRSNAETWETLLNRGLIRPGRPDDSTWSSLEYACHVRDVYRRYDERMSLMLNEDDPLFPNWEQDASAIEDRYDKQRPAQVIHELRTAADKLAARLDHVVAADWLRNGRRTDGASFTLATLARYMIHDPIHHVWDVTRPKG